VILGNATAPRRQAFGLFRFGCHPTALPSPP
jgi:hypothetical protein